MKTLLWGNGAVSLDDVYPYQTIDSAPEAAFDTLTRLVAYVCQTPVALLYLLDGRRRWIKSQVGLEQESSDAYLALCEQMLLQVERWNSLLLIVQDPSTDQRFANDQWVTSLPTLKFYAGVPLVTPQGLILGILSVIDRVPRELTRQQQKALLTLSRQAISLTARCADVQLELRENLASRERIVSNHQPVEKVQQASRQELEDIDIELILDSSSLVAITDHKGKIHSVNDQFCKISKYSRAELDGANHRLLNSSYHSSKFFNQMWTTISSGKIWKGEIRNRAKDGSYYWVATTIVPILNAQGKSYDYVSICQDITPCKQTENKHDRFFTLSPDLLSVIGLDGYFKCVNPAFEQTLLYTSEELLSRPFLDFVHPEDKANTQTELEKLATNTQVESQSVGEDSAETASSISPRSHISPSADQAQPTTYYSTSTTPTIQFENRYRCQDGSYKWLAWSSFLVIEDGLIYAIARDITKNKQTEATLLEQANLLTLEAEVGAALGQGGTLSESLKRSIEAIVQHLDALGAGIWTVNPAAVASDNHLSLDLQASAGQLIPSDTFPNHIPPNHGLIGVIAQTRQPINIQLSTQDQQVGTVPSEGTPGHPPYATFFTGYPLIVESRLVAVIALHSRQPFSNVVHGVFGWIANAIAVAIDRAWARTELLRRREALLFQLASQIRNSLDLNTILGTVVTEIRNLLGVDCCQFLWSWFGSNQPSLSVTHEACGPKLPSRLGECPLPQFEPLGRAIRNLQMLRIDDLTTAVGLDSEMRSLLADWGITSGLLLPLKTKTGQLGAIICTHHNGSRLWSDHEVELLQAVVDELAIAIEHAELFAETRASALAAQTQASQLELALHDLQQAESRLIQTEKMSSLGQMVAGIAHEINNPVSFITGNLLHATNYIQDLLDLIDRYQQHYPNPDPEIQDYITEIDLEFLIEDLPKILSSMQVGADRIHEIVLSLRNFSRLDEAVRKPVNIHDGIDTTLLILHNRLKPSGNNPGITVIKEYGNLPPVECYAGQLNQVFMNIISNAIDALETEPEPRRITIRTEVLNSDAVIRIQDNGSGMTPCVIRRLFDPFFTTKPVGKGTGLGLAISYQIVVEKHGGLLKCLSEPGNGAEFWIQIPIASSLP